MENPSGRGIQHEALAECGLSNGLNPLEIPLKIPCRHTSRLSVDEGLQLGVHGVHPCQAEVPLQRLVDGWFRAFPQDDMGGNRSVSSNVFVRRETVRAQYGSLLDAILQGFPDVVAISHHLLHARPVAIDGGDHGNLVPGQPALDGFPSPARRSRRWRIASLPATTALEALAEIRLVDLHDAFQTPRLVVAERFEDHLSPAPQRSSGNSDLSELVQIVKGPMSGRQGL